MSGHNAGQAIPEITREEHQHNLEAKRVVVLDRYGNQIQDDYDIRWDDTSTANITYVGWASPGTASSTSLWQIMAVDSVNKTTKWADGTSEFIKVWDSRTGYTYS